MDKRAKQRIALLFLMGTLPIHASYALDAQDYLVPSSKYEADKEKNPLLAANQYTVTQEATQTINNLAVNFYTSNAQLCTDTPLATVNMIGGVNMDAGAYISTNQSNFALCSAYPSGCAAAFSASGAVQFVYSLTLAGVPYTITGNCIPAKMQDSGGLACTSSTDCGFSTTASDTLHNSGKLFVTTAQSNGSFSIPFRNSTCANEAASASIPGTYVPLLYSDTNKWNLMPSVNFYNVAGTLVSSSDSNGVGFTTLNNKILLADGTASSGKFFWTGYAGLAPSQNTSCKNWTDGNSGDPYGIAGYGDTVPLTGWYDSTTAADCGLNMLSLLCVSYNY